MSIRAALLLLATFAIWVPGHIQAEIYFLPKNVSDTARRGDALATDTSLPFIYLEPHEVCFDEQKPIPVTVCAVNRSSGTLKFDWQSILQALSLEAVGPGGALPRSSTRAPDPCEVETTRLASKTVDLKDLFEIQGVSVYRLSYARVLGDGRTHFAAPVTFTVEDFDAVGRLAKAFDADFAGKLIARMLEHNNLFSRGVEPKTYGNDGWWQQPEMNHSRWDGSVSEADEHWRNGIELLTQNAPPPNDFKALEALIDRIMWISGSFRCPPVSRLFPWNFDVERRLPVTARERIGLKLVRARDRRVVSHAMACLSEVELTHHHQRRLSPETLAALSALFELADGGNKELANEAIGRLSDYRPNRIIAQFLRRKFTDNDPELALHAAIVSCYSGDGTGFPIVLRCAESQDSKLRLNAVAQLGSPQFRKHSDEIVRVLLNELKNPFSDTHLQRAIDSLGSYNRPEVREALTPFLNHSNEQVRARARLSLQVLGPKK